VRIPLTVRSDTKEHNIDVPRSLTADVLHASFAIYDYIVVVLPQTVDAGADHTVGSAVASRALGTSHGKKVYLLRLHKGLAYLYVQVVLLSQAGLHCPGLYLGRHLLPDLAHGIAKGHAQGQIEIGGGSASMASTAPFRESSLMSRAAIVVLPLPPLPAIAMVVVILCQLERPIR